jgi:2-dehydro-3-deoxyphosphogluconate aldolase/(4S)-4-hydroxy-2-oxoglutarate aldolase
VTAIDDIAAQRVLPVLRSASAEEAIATARACARAGMRVIELTLSTPDVAAATRVLAREGLTVGVGTLTDVTQVREAATAGASFVVSFAALTELIAAAAEYGLLAIPGAMTPTEVLHCLRAGAEVVKLFPARELSPSYLRDLRAVTPDLRAIVTGGIGPEDPRVAEWLAEGALAVGIGSALGSASVERDAEVERRARAALAQSSPTAGI